MTRVRERLRRPYPVSLRRARDGHERGACFAWTWWGGDRIRWYWVRHLDGSERAYSSSQVEMLHHASTCECRTCVLARELRLPLVADPVDAG